MTPLISVIVPIYNVEKYLCRSIDSILAQTYTNLEIILIDDGSTDSSPRICDEYANKDSRVKVVHQINKGVAASRNTGVSLAKGDYIYFVDSDDYIESDLCEKLVCKFDETKADIIIFDYYIVDDKGNLTEPDEKVGERILSSEDALCELMSCRLTGYVWNKMCKRNVYNTIVFPEGRVWEDMAVSHKLILNAEKVCCTSQKLYYYYMRQGSIIHSLSFNSLCDIFYARHSSYNDLKSDYDYAAELVFPRVVLSAFRLYDRSLWEKNNREELDVAVQFLADNKDKALKQCGSFSLNLYYKTPALYRFMRKFKHRIGNVVKAIKK